MMKDELASADEAFEAFPQTSSLAGLPNRVVSIVTDSAGQNVKAKKALAVTHPHLILSACGAHQQNLVCGNVLCHPACKLTVKRAKELVTFFNTHSHHKGIVHAAMIELFGGKFEFVVDGETHWYSHYGLFTTITRAKPSLVVYKTRAKSEDDDEGLSPKVVDTLDTIGASSFWVDLSLFPYCSES